MVRGHIILANRHCIPDCLGPLRLSYDIKLLLSLLLMMAHSLFGPPVKGFVGYCFITLFPLIQAIASNLSSKYV